MANSLSAVGVACHEAGLPCMPRYAPLKLRGSGAGHQLQQHVCFLCFLCGTHVRMQPLVYVGCALFAAAFLLP